MFRGFQHILGGFHASFLNLILSLLFLLLLPAGVLQHAVNDLHRLLKFYTESTLNLKALLDKFVV